MESSKKIVVFSFAFLILFSTAGLSISSHFCGGRLVESGISFAGHKVGCEMKMELSSCSSKEKVMANSCCQDDFFQISVDELLPHSLSSLNVLIHNIDLISVSLFASFESVLTCTQTIHRSPPLMNPGKQLLFFTGVLRL